MKTVGGIGEAGIIDSNKVVDRYGRSSESSGLRPNGGGTGRNEASPLPLGEWRGVGGENKEVNSKQGI